MLNETYTSRDHFSEFPDDVSVDDVEFQINNFKEIVSFFNLLLFVESQ